jgi:amidase
MEGSRVHAFGPDLLADHDAVTLADMVRRREVSPVELARAAIDRAEQVNGRLNAISCSDYERALSEATTPRDGLLAGVPTFVKDNIDLCGLPTRHGSEAVPDTPAAKDEAFARQYRSLGLCVLGKSTMPEFGLNCSTEYQGRPATRNPWHTDHSCGGSSGGSAALVTAGVVPIAHANDGAGSIRIPAAWCGLVGLKPSRGRLLPAQVARSLPVKIVVDGVLTRTVRDTAHFFAGSEQHWRNAKLPAIGLVEGPGRRPLNIGLITDSPIGVPTSPEICRVVEQTGEMLAGLGHRVEQTHLKLPRSFANDFTDYWTFIAFSIRRFGRLHFGRQFDADKLDDLTRELARHFQRRWWRLPLALLRLQKIARRHTFAHQEHDLLLSPVTSRIAPELGILSPDQPFDELFQRMQSCAAFTPLNNALGTPAIAVPVGTADNGLPIGVQLSAKYGQDRLLLEIAYHLEEAGNWRRITDS